MVHLVGLISIKVSWNFKFPNHVYSEVSIPPILKETIPPHASTSDRSIASKPLISLACAVRCQFCWVVTETPQFRENAANRCLYDA